MQNITLAKVAVPCKYCPSDEPLVCLSEESGDI